MLTFKDRLDSIRQLAIDYIEEYFTEPIDLKPYKLKEWEGYITSRIVKNQQEIQLLVTDYNIINLHYIDLDEVSVDNLCTIADIISKL